MFENVNTNTVSLTDYQLKSPTLAKVILSFTGHHTKESIRAAVVEQLDGAASVVENSFRVVSKGVAVGFLKANREVRAIEPTELKAGYKLVGSNIFMDAKDKSLWSKREGAAGVYLTRQGHEDLSELLEASQHNNRTDVPKLHHLAIAKAAPSELLAFVTPEGSMDYGFPVAQKDDRVKVVSFYGRVPSIVSYNDVVSITPVTLDSETKTKIQAGLTRAEKDNAIAYWKALYSYDPDYMQKVIEEVEEDTVA